MRVTIDRGDLLPLYLQIAASIRESLATGQVVAGYKMPAERDLATDLGVTRTTVLQAYQLLKSEGLLVSHVGRGTFVSADGISRNSRGDGAERLREPAHTENPTKPSWPLLFSDYSNRFTYRDIATTERAQEEEGIIDFATGSQNPRDIPDTLLRHASLEAFASHSFDGRPGSPVEGFEELRELVAKHMRYRNVECDTRNVMILSGAEQGIDLCVRTFINPGDVVLVEQTTYFPALQAFSSADAHVVGIPLDDEGMRTDLVEEYCKRLHPKLIYTVPTFQNPTGVTMSDSRRRQLLHLASKYGFLIIEDDPYGLLDYSEDTSPAIVPLKGMENAGFVLYLSTLSKTVTPGIRTGWMVADTQVLARVVALRRMVDQYTSSSSQRICAQLLESGEMMRHVDYLKGQYRVRRDSLVHSLAACAPQDVEYSIPRGGYYAWLKLPKGLRSTPLLEYARTRDVAFMPGKVFDAAGKDDSHLRLNFVRPEVQDIGKGVQRLCEAMTQARSALSSPLSPLSPL